MTRSPARQLILAYAAVLALTYVALLIPSDSWSAGGGMEGLLVGIALGAFIVWLLWHGSEGGWLFALGSTLFTLVGLTLMGPGVELASILLIASGVAQLLTLVSSPVRAHICARPRPEAASG